MAVFDVRLTARRVAEYGPDAEVINPAVYRSVKWFGPQLGVLLSILIPTTIWCALFAKLGMDWALGVIAGWRFRFFIQQWESLKFEKEIKAIKAVLDSRNKQS